MDRIKIIKIFGGFLAVMLIFTILSRAVSGAAMARVETVRIATGPIEHTVSASGRVEAGREVAVYTQSGQRVQEICVNEGDSVEEGDVLFTLDMAELGEQIASRQQEIEKIKLQSEDVQNARALEQRSQQTARQRAQEDYNQAITQGDSSIAEAKSAWDAAEQELLEFNNSHAAPQGAGAGSDPSEPQGTGSNDPSAQDEGAGSDPSEPQGTGTGSEEPDSQRSSEADIQAQREALEQAAAQAKEAYNAAVSARNDNIRSAARALEDAAQAKSAPDSTTRQNEITIQQQEVTLEKLRKLQEAEGQVKATVSGVVTQIIVATGDFTSDGAALRLADTSQGCRVTLSVDKSNEEYVGRGSPVNIKKSGDKEAIGDYTVTNVAVNEQDDTMLDISIDLPKDLIEAGTLVDVEIVPKSESYASVLPLQALHEEQNGYYVLILQEVQGVMGAELVVKRLDVKVVDKNTESAALEEGLLTNEQEVISSSSRMIQEGSKVRRKEE